MNIMRKLDNKLLENLQAYYIENIMKEFSVDELTAQTLFLESLQNEGIEQHIFASISEVIE